jgi:hypothetical protein
MYDMKGGGYLSSKSSVTFIDLLTIYATKAFLYVTLFRPGRIAELVQACTHLNFPSVRI